MPFIIAVIFMLRISLNNQKGIKRLKHIYLFLLKAYGKFFIHKLVCHLGTIIIVVFSSSSSWATTACWKNAVAWILKTRKVWLCHTALHRLLIEASLKFSSWLTNSWVASADTVSFCHHQDVDTELHSGCTLSGYHEENIHIFIYMLLHNIFPNNEVGPFKMKHVREPNFSLLQS